MLEENFQKIIEMIEKRRDMVYHKITEQQILLYLEIGQFLFEIKASSGYGAKVIDKAAKWMKDNYPAAKNYNRRNLYRMVEFYETYKDSSELLKLTTQLSWSNNLLILDGTKDNQEREFYLKLSIKERYSKRELDRQLDSAYYQRYLIAPDKNLLLPSTTKTIDEDDYPNTKILDLYSLEFLDLPNNYSEKDFKNEIIKNMKNFILEVGKNFTFIEEEYRVQVGKQDFFIDLLFFSRELSCLVAFELKIGKYKAEYASKMALYLEALDRDVKRKEENPSVGIILCTSKDDAVVEYSMSKSMSQTLVSEYKLKLIDRKLLENKLKQVKELLENEKDDEK
ncbi:MAG: PDDEXK nuclease domain-containing protein [Lactobacillales bacterium]|nr:PDDEXK nuclease domain-containing protein [Lactobacillales bacterium]